MVNSRVKADANRFANTLATGKLSVVKVPFTVAGYEATVYIYDLTNDLDDGGGDDGCASGGTGHRHDHNYHRQPHPGGPGTDEGNLYRILLSQISSLKQGKHDLKMNWWSSSNQQLMCC